MVKCCVSFPSRCGFYCQEPVIQNTGMLSAPRRKCVMYISEIAPYLLFSLCQQVWAFTGFVHI